MTTTQGQVIKGDGWGNCFFLESENRQGVRDITKMLFERESSKCERGQNLVGQNL